MGRLRLQAWQHIGTSQHVLDWVQYGIKIPFKKEPAEVWLQNKIHGKSQEKFISVEISRLLKSGAISKCYNWRPKCVMPMRCIPKNNKNRLVVDCRYLNECINTPKFSQEGIEAVADQIEENYDVISADLKDRFL